MKVTVSMPRNSGEHEMKRTIQTFADVVVNDILGLAKRSGTVKISVRKTVLKKNELGLCTDSNEIVVSDDLAPFEFMETLAHELVHVRQFVTGQYSEWKAKTSEKTPWKDLPWEIEANALERDVARCAAIVMIKNNPRLRLGWGSDSGRLASFFAVVYQNLQIKKAA